MSAVQDAEVGVRVSKIVGMHGDATYDHEGSPQKAMYPSRGRATARTNSMTPPDSRVAKVYHEWNHGDHGSSPSIMKVIEMEHNRQHGVGDMRDDGESFRSTPRSTLSDLDGFSSAEEEASAPDEDALYYGECRGDLPSRTGAQEGDDMVGLLAGCRCSGGSGENADVPCPVAEKQARFLEQPRECARCDRATRQAITRGEPARRPRLKPVLYIEIEDKASEKPVDAKAQGRYGPEGRHGGTNVDDNPQGCNEALCGCITKCLRRADAIYHTLAGTVKFTRIEQAMVV